MNIKVNNKEIKNPLERMFWGIFASIIVFISFSWVALLFFLILLALAAPIWIPILLILLFSHK